MGRTPKRKFTQYAPVPAHMQGQTPDLTKFGIARRCFDETPVAAAPDNHLTIIRLQSALKMRRQHIQNNRS